MNDKFNEIQFDVTTKEATTEELDEEDFGLLIEQSEDDSYGTITDSTTQSTNDYSTDTTIFQDLTTQTPRLSRKRNRNRNRTTSAPLVSDTELLIIGKELFDKETSNLIKYVNINYQNQTTKNGTKDCASQKY